MKLAFFNEDESWFWILDESGRFWCCWYESDTQHAMRIEKYDRSDPHDVLAIIHAMTLDAAVAAAL